MNRRVVIKIISAFFGIALGLVCFFIVTPPGAETTIKYLLSAVILISGICDGILTVGYYRESKEKVEEDKS